MKKLLLLFTSLILFGCSNDDSNNSVNSSDSPYNPPAWIQGTWGYPASDFMPENKFYKFTSDNVCQITQTISNCWKEGIEQFPELHSGEDSSTSTTYQCSFSSNNGATTLTLYFQKVSDTEIKWINNGTQDYILTKLD